jgi:hypothetical protein
MIIFGSVWFLSKKITKPKLLKKNRNWIKPIWLGFLSFFRFWIGFSGLARVFSGFFSVWFFWFFAYKTETKPAGFLKF